MNKKSIISFSIVLMLTVMVTGCISPSDSSADSNGDMDATEYLEFMLDIGEKEGKLTNESVRDFDDFNLGIMTDSELISRERTRTVDFKRLLRDVESVEPPIEYQRFHEYYIKSIEYRISSIELFIEGFIHSDMSLRKQAAEHFEISQEYKLKYIEELDD